MKLLAMDNVVLPAGFLDFCDQYLAMIRASNERLGLVSAGDVDLLVERHLVDSLSLLPTVTRHIADLEHPMLLDIGSGGGFPAIPLLLACERLRGTLVERSPGKVGFLQRVRVQLGLERVEVRLGEYPQAVKEVRADILTARAVDKPGRLVQGICEGVERDRCVFLCQSDEMLPRLRAMFHVEPVDDLWKSWGLRRGGLYVVTARESAAGRDVPRGTSSGTQTD